MAKKTTGEPRATGVRLVDALNRMRGRDLPHDDGVVLAQLEECLRELIEAPWMSDMVLERLRRGTKPLEWPGAPTVRTREVLRSLSDSGKREYIRQLLGKATKPSERAVLEAAFASEFGAYFPE